MKIVLTGAQGTGKTSVLKQFSSIYLPISEVARMVSKEGLKINEEGDDNTQYSLFRIYERLLDQQVNWISDRGLVDVLAYTFWLYSKGKVSKKCKNELIKRFLEFNKTHTDIRYAYFPIEFPLTDDGIRSLNPDFQKEVDEFVKLILDTYKLPYITVSGNIENRCGQILCHLVNN